MVLHDHDIEQMAPALGTREAARVDPDRVATAVVERLRAVQRREQRGWLEFRVLRAAAVALLVAGGTWILTLGRGVPDVGTAVPVALSGLETRQLVAVLDSLDGSAPLAELVPTGLNDLSERELQELLAMMEG